MLIFRALPRPPDARDPVFSTLMSAARLLPHMITSVLALASGLTLHLLSWVGSRERAFLCREQHTHSLQQFILLTREGWGWASAAVAPQLSDARRGGPEPPLGLRVITQPCSELSGRVLLHKLPKEPSSPPLLLTPQWRDPVTTYP